MWTALAPWQRAIFVVLVILGILAIIAGAIYLAEPLKSLPSFFPDHSKHSTDHGTKHGIAAVVAGVVLIGIALVVGITARRNRY